jgi:hypothetical protein
VFCLQAMDAAGKDGTIRHVMSGVNPQGVHVTSFNSRSCSLTSRRLPAPDRPPADVRNRVRMARTRIPGQPASAPLSSGPRRNLLHRPPVAVGIGEEHE